MILDSLVALPREIAEQVHRFASVEPMADVWARYPLITDAEDAATDAVACVTMSERFADFLAEHGFTVWVVYAEDAAHPWAMDHAWVRVQLLDGFVDVDLTARQFHNLELDDAYSDAVLSAAWPMAWSSTNVHPVAGTFRAVSRVQAMHFAVAR